MADLSLLVKRDLFGDDSTGGKLYVDGVFECFTLEDEIREEKVFGETAIPPLTTEILLRNEGGMTAKYKKRFGEFHQGMLWLQNVPGFNWVYIHIGNNDDHTDGCVLVGQDRALLADGNSEVYGSEAAYVSLYKKIIAAMDDGRNVTIQII